VDRLQEKRINILSDLFGDPRRSGSERLYYCKKCGHHKKKLSINLTEDVWHCWVCDYKGRDISRLIKRYGTPQDYQNWIGARIVTVPNDEQVLELFSTNSSASPAETKLVLPEEFISLVGNSSKESKKPLEYLQSRGVDQGTILKWKIGYCHTGFYAGRIIVPSFDDVGAVNYFIARSYVGSWRKYEAPNTTKDIIFNDLYVDWTKTIILTEGVFDAMRVDNSIPILGTTLNEKSFLFQKIVKTGAKVIVALDRAAHRNAHKIATKLLSYGLEVKVAQIGSKRDLGEMERWEAEECILRSIPCSSNVRIQELLRIGI
jgi:DNA primase